MSGIDSRGTTPATSADASIATNSMVPSESANHPPSLNSTEREREDNSSSSSVNSIGPATSTRAGSARLLSLLQRSQALVATTASSALAPDNLDRVAPPQEVAEHRADVPSRQTYPVTNLPNAAQDQSLVGTSAQLPPPSTQAAGMPLVSSATVPAIVPAVNVNVSASAPAAAPLVLCHSTIEELLTLHEKVPQMSALNLLSGCPCCSHMVARHPRMPVGANLAAAAAGLQEHMVVGSHALSRSSTSSVIPPGHSPAIMKVGEGFLKLKRELPVWKEGNRKSCFEFLRELTELLSTTEYPPKTWYRVLPLVVEEGYSRTWVHNNIVSRDTPPSTWEEACELFTSHFESADYTGRLWSKWHSLRFDNGESVQRFADRFMVMLGELGLSSQDTIVKKHFVRCLPANIRQRYDEFCLSKDLTTGQLELSATYEPDDVETMVNICVKIDTNLRNRSLSSSSTFAAPSINSSAAKRKVSSSSSNRCQVHPDSSHSWSDCRKNPKNAAFGLKQGDKTSVPSGAGNRNHSRGSSSSSSTNARRDVEGKPKDNSHVKCFKCEKTGHYANRCPNSAATKSATGNAPVASVKVLGSSHAGTNTDTGTSGFESKESTLDGQSESKMDTGGPSTSTVLGSGKIMLDMVSFVSKSRPGKTTLKAFVDTGSDLSVINRSTARDFNLPTCITTGRLSLAIANSYAERANCTFPLDLKVVLVPPPSEDGSLVVTRKIEQVRLELLPFPHCDYEVIIGKDLIPEVFPQGIPLEYLAAPPPILYRPTNAAGTDGSIKFAGINPDLILADSIDSDEEVGDVDSDQESEAEDPNDLGSLCVSPTTNHKEASLAMEELEATPQIAAATLESSSSSPSSTQSQGSHKGETTSRYGPIIELPIPGNGARAVDKLADIRDPATGKKLSDTVVDMTAEDLENFQPLEKDSAVFTPSTLEDEYKSQREKLMSDKDITKALQFNEKVSGFCTHPDSVLQLHVKPFADGKIPRTLCRPQYRIPEKATKLVDENIQRWLSEGKIVKAPPGIPYNNPIVVAPKKDAEGNVTYDEIRVCLDFRGLNEWLEVTQKDQFQLPYIRDTINKFEGCKIFGEFDLAEAFYQFKLHESSRPYTAFTFGGIQYMCAGVPFGLSIVPSHFQRVISTIMQGLNFTFPYMDNLPFASKDWDTHKEHALTIIRLMTNNNLRIKPSSVKLGHSHMRCLGHFVSVNGIGIDPKKLSMIPDWPRPKTGKELMSFLGFVTFIRDHVRHIAELTAPLEAVKNQKTLVWNNELECAFTLTKSAVMKAPFLQYPDYSRPFHIATDASNTGVGGVLFQPKTEDEYITPTNIVAICSKKLADCQTRWSAYKKEYFGILYCLRQFRPYVWGRDDLVVHTDHKPLTYVLKSPSLSTTVHGWFDEMSEFNFKVVHRPGILNVLPDALSRMYMSTYKDAETWGVTKGFDFANITLVDPLTHGGKPFSLLDVTGPKEKPPSLKLLTHSGVHARTLDNSPSFDAVINCESNRPVGCCDLELETSTGISAEGMARYNKLWSAQSARLNKLMPSIRILGGEEAAAPKDAPHDQQQVSTSSNSNSSSEQEIVAADLEVNSSEFTDPEVEADLPEEAEKRGVTIPRTKRERRDLVEKEHAMGHFGIDAIYKSLRSKNIWWPGMRNTIVSIVQDCHTCNVFTVGKKGYNPLNYIHASGPWEHVQVDTSVHMPPSPDGHTTLLIVIDVFTGFAQLRACKSSTAEEIAKELWDIFCIFGFPKILQSDNGHEFVNDLLRTLTKISGVEHRFISPYNPRADGKVERAVCTLVFIIKKMVHGSKMFWSIYVPFAQYTFNCKIAALTGSAPFALMFGRAPNEWKDYTKDPPETIPLDPDEKLSKWKEHQDKMVSLLMPAISRKVLKAKEEMVARLNNMRKALIPKSVPAGTEVYVIDPQKENKWQPKYLGPYTVVRRSLGGSYVLRDSTGDILDRHVPIDQIKVLSSKAKRALENPDHETKQSEPSYAVESVVSHRGDNPSNYEYLVKWKHYPSSENTWEPTESFDDREVINRYWARIRKSKEVSAIPTGNVNSSSTLSSTNTSEKSTGKRRRL